MTLAAGTRFGPYEVVSPLGAGGMGEVYRARDTRLNREVALKVLPEVFAADPDRLARFTREAQLLAALNHPNIAAIHGLEDLGGRQALVLELVEGPTLADRIAQGPLPLEDALAIARQIAEALETAHDQGIIHRDLKPANVKLRPDGTVKVLDFGLAKALSQSDPSGSMANAGVRPADVTASPTVLSPATMTTAGVILGTAAYMAPEQARGKAADRRADIWAFGCVLYEMLTGRRAFAGDDVADTLASILRGAPAWDALPPATPPAIRRLLRRSLEKNPRERLQAIGDARLEIAEAVAPADAAAVATVTAHRIPMVPVIAAAVVIALLAATAAWMLKPAVTGVEPRVTRSLVAADALDQRPRTAGETRGPVGRPGRTALALSPDGRLFAFRGYADDRTGWQLYLRRIDGLDAEPIPGTIAAHIPFFSPDGAWLAYSDEGELRRVPTTGGAVSSTRITRVPESRRVMSASWGDGDVIVFATADGLWRVSASGGTPERISELQQGENQRSLPHLLPGSRAVLFTRQKTVFRWDDAQVGVRTLATGDEKMLLDDAADGRYVSSGHIVFMRRGTLMAVPFDAERLELTGSPVTVLDDVMQAVNMGNTADDTGAGQFAAAADGTLVYISGGLPAEGRQELVWVDRARNVIPIAAPPRGYSSPRLSPDGSRIVAFTGPSSNGLPRLWLYDLARGTSSALTSAEEPALWGAWSPDGTKVVFEALVAGGAALSVRSSDGTGGSESLLQLTGGALVPTSWSRDGTLAFVKSGRQGSDVWVMDVDAGDRRGRAVVETPAEDLFPVLSPDGKWLAYASNESGRFEVYVQPYPGPGMRIPVSPAGGIAPAWRGDGTELFYQEAAAGGGIRMRAVPLTVTGSSISAGSPITLFEGRYGASNPARGYDVTPDGRRFLMVRGIDPPPPGPTPMVLVQNWFEELRRLAPPRKER